MKVLGNKLFSMLILGLLVLSYFYELPNEFAHKVALASVEEPGAFLTGVIFDQGVNDDNDTKFEWLEIGIQINVTECDQQYGVKCKELFSSDSNVIFVDTDVVTEPFELGLQTQYIYIPSPWIFCSGLNPIALYNVELISYSDERGVNTIGLLEQIPLSREYSYTEFTPPGAKLTGVIFEQGLDYNEDGTFDFLQIGVQVNVTKEADYCISVSGGMYSGQVHFLGLQLANITISGKMISVSNQNIRSIDYIILNDYSGYRIQRIDDVPLSREYLYTEFDKPGALLTGNIHDRGVDEDDDSTFDYLEIVAEVNVTYTGNYYVGASRLVVNKTHSIPIGGGQYLDYVDSGMYNVSVKIDGSAVYSSQMNPINVSIEVWGEMMDYHQNIMDVSLSRRYNYKEFDQPQFNEGDWGKYKVSATWHSSNPETTEPTSITETNKITSMIIEVQDVFGQTITLSKTSTYQDGASEQIQANSYEMYTIPSNLKTNDTIPGSYIAFSPAVETRGIYAGMERDLIYGKINTSFFGMNMSMDAFWDRSTGILCQMNTTIESSFGEETTRQSTLTEIVDTNLWERVISARASLDLYENYGFWTEDDFIEAGTQSFSLNPYISINNFDDETGSELSQIEFYTKATGITGVEREEDCSWDSTYANWAFPEDIVPNGEYIGVGFSTDGTHTMDYPISMDRKFDETVFEEDGTQTATFTVTFNNLDFLWSSGRVEALNHEEAEVSIVDFDLSGIPLANYYYSPEDPHSLNFDFNNEELIAGAPYVFTVTLSIHPTGNYAGPVEYKPSFSLPYTYFCEYEEVGYGIQAIFPPNMLPASMTELWTTTEPENTWRIAYLTSKEVTLREVCTITSAEQELVNGIPSFPILAILVALAMYYYMRTISNGCRR